MKQSYNLYIHHPPVYFQSRLFAQRPVFLHGKLVHSQHLFSLATQHDFNKKTLPVSRKGRLYSQAMLHIAHLPAF